jgi:membrane protein DedA with SNARE-associated domain/rhodanese-related sulfurtransferase
MQALDQLGQYHGLLLLAALLLAGAGLPLPMMPLLLATGALASAGKMNPAEAILLPPMCLALGDILWFFLGRKFGHGILSTVCRISFERDTCIRKTQDTFSRHGLRALLVSRFIPGLSTLASPMAGATGKSFLDFLMYESTGTVIYTSTYVALGYLFADQIDRIVATIGGAGTRLGAALILGLVAYAGYKVLMRWWLIRKSDALAITAREAAQKRAAHPELLIIDLRGPIDSAADPFVISGAKRWREKDLMDMIKDLPANTAMILFCACPNQASSTRLALALRRRGFRNVWPLRDGMEGWRAAGFPVQPMEVPLVMARA